MDLAAAKADMAAAVVPAAVAVEAMEVVDTAEGAEAQAAVAEEVMAVAAAVVIVCARQIFVSTGPASMWASTSTPTLMSQLWSTPMLTPMPAQAVMLARVLEQAQVAAQRSYRLVVEAQP